MSPRTEYRLTLWAALFMTLLFVVSLAAPHVRRTLREAAATIAAGVGG